MCEDFRTPQDVAPLAPAVESYSLDGEVVPRFSTDCPREWRPSRLQFSTFLQVQKVNQARLTFTVESHAPEADGYERLHRGLRIYTRGGDLMSMRWRCAALTYRK